MIKKISKYLVIAFTLLLIPKLSVFAREVNVDDLGQRIEVLEKEYVEDIDSYYIIGNYVFTSHHQLDTRDIMLAARSINMDDSEYNGNNLPNALGKMTIHKVQRKFDESYNPIGWEILDNYVGETDLTAETKFNIKYIDYKYLKDLYTVTLETDSDEDYKESITVEEGGKIDRNSITGENAPTKAGKQFKEWVKADDESKPWNFESDTVTSNTKLKATWYDEVNTDELIKKAKETINNGTKTHGHYYDVDFAAGDKNIIFNVYDLNMKNSKIQGTGLIGDIVSIVNNENVTSITISNGKEGNVTFEKKDVVDGAGPTSKAWKQFAVLLCTLTGKDCSSEDETQQRFQEITLGDLVKITDELTLTINLNETNARSQNNQKEESYKIKFVYNSNAELGKEIPAADVKDLETKFGYIPEDTYTIEKTENGLYKVKGYVTESENIKGFGADTTNKFYFAFTINLADGVNSENVTVKIPKGPTEGDGYNVATKDDFVDGKLTVLMEVEKSESTKYRDIILLIDDVPTKIRIDFSELRYVQSSIFTVEAVDDDEDPFDNLYGWSEETGYNTVFAKIDNNSTKWTVSGLLPIFNEWNSDPFPVDYGDYYLGIKIKLDDKLATNEYSDKITIKFFHDDEEEASGKAVIDKSDFGESNEIYVLKFLTYANVDGSPIESSEKTFEITVDLDGDGEDYAPYTITIDWSNLKLQGESKSSDYEPVTAEDLSEDEKETLEETWGFDFALDDIKYTTQINPEHGEYHTGLQGTIKEQTLEDEANFEEPSGYYVPVKITIPDDIPEEYNSKWIIWLKDEDGSYQKVERVADNYNARDIVVLFKMKDEKQNISYKIDYDGDGNDYLPEEETITTNFEYLSENKITYKYKDNEGKDKTEDVTVYEKDTVTLKDLKIDNDYRTFDKWTKADETDASEGLTTGHDEDLILTAHWTLDADAFVNAVIDDLNNPESTISENYSEKFKITIGDDNNITIDAIDSRMLLSDMNDTTIPGAIAYILQKGEIKSVTLATDGKKVVFTKDGANNVVTSKVALDDEGTTLKNSIKQGAKLLFANVLLADEGIMTLSKMALDDKSFTLEIGDCDKNVTLVDNDNKTYTFSFDTEAVTIDNEEDLTKALSNQKISHIYLGQDIEVTKQHIINRPLVINGGKKDEDESYKISVKKGNQTDTPSIFKVSSSRVTIDNIELSDTNEAIIVDGEGAELTSTGLKLTDIELAGIEGIKGKVDAREVTFASETHDIPTARIQTKNRKNATIKIAGAEENDPTYIHVKQHRSEWCKDEGEKHGKEDESSLQNCTEKSLYDEYDWTKDTYYYLNSSNIKHYVLKNFMGAFNEMWIGRIYEAGQKVGSFDEYFGKVSVKVTLKDEPETQKTLYFVGYGSTRRSDSDLKEGKVYYKDLITNIAEDELNARSWYFANFAERDETKKVTISDIEGLDGIDKSTTYYTYKFADKTDGMTIGELKAIDHNFAEMWQKLDAKAKESSKAIKYTKGGSGEQNADDNTKIDGEIKLKIS